MPDKRKSQRAHRSLHVAVPIKHGAADKVVIYHINGHGMSQSKEWLDAVGKITVNYDAVIKTLTERYDSAFISQTKPRRSFPRLWFFLKFVMSKQTRERVFVPAYYDLLSDHLETRRERESSKAARRW